MPTISDRQLLIGEVVDLLALAILEDEDDEDLVGLASYVDWVDWLPFESIFFFG